MGKTNENLHNTEMLLCYSKHYANLKVAKKRQEDLIAYLQNYRKTFSIESDKCAELVNSIDSIIKNHSYYFLTSEPDIRRQAYSIAEQELYSNKNK